MKETPNMAALVKMAVAYGLGSTAFGGAGGSSSSQYGNKMSAGYSGANAASGTSQNMSRSQEQSAALDTASYASLALGGGGALAKAPSVVNVLRHLPQAFRTAPSAAKGLWSAAQSVYNPAAQSVARAAGGVSDAQAFQDFNVGSATRRTSTRVRSGSGRAGLSTVGRTVQNGGDAAGAVYDEAKSRLMARIPFYGLYNNINTIRDYSGPGA